MSRLSLPFLEACSRLDTPEDFLVDGLYFCRLDDDPSNPLNSPAVFEKVNAALAYVNAWRFNAAVAREYLASLELDQKAKVKLEPW